MSLQNRLSDLITAVATDWKNTKVWIFGSLNGSLADLITTDKSSIVAAINEVKSTGGGGAPPDASETVKGIAQIATQAETDTGTNDAKFVTPKKFSTRLAAYAQPLSANLTTLAGVASGAFGRTLLGAATKADAQNALSLAPVALSGSASDLTTGMLPTNVLPPLAISETFPVNSQAEMLALTAQQGDVAIRSDQGGKFYWLAANDPSVLANWKVMVANGDVSSVNSKTGAVVLVKADVGLGNVDNTSDANKPVSTAQAAAISGKLAIASNLSDLADVAAARNNLSVYSKAELGNPETDLVALYTAAKA